MAEISRGIHLICNFPLYSSCRFILNRLMETLGLSGPPSEHDNILKRLFWPGNYPSEVDSLGQQGFWVCAAISLFGFLTLAYQRHWLMAPFAAFVYLLGGVCVREHSFKAVILVTSAFLLDFFSTILIGRFPGIPSVVSLVLLVANLRGTWIASQWKESNPNEFPSRLNETWRDKLADQMPARVWPRARGLFYTAVSLYLLLEAFGISFLLLKGGFPRHL